MKILYTTDGSDASRSAAALLAALVNRSDVELTVLSVAEVELMFAEAYFVEGDLLGEVRRRSKQLVDAATSEFRDVGFTAQGHVIEGRPGPTIVRSAKIGGYDLVVVGAASKSWMGKLLLGSVSTHVLHASPCAVLVVHEPPAQVEHLKVLVATDGSGSADGAAAALTSIADPSGCEVTVMSVAEVPNLLVAGYPFAPLAGVSPEIVTDLLERARSNSERLVHSLRSAGFAAESVVTEGSPRSLILDRAQAGGYDLVVLGTQGHGPILSGVLGSVSDAVSRHAKATLVGRVSGRASGELGGSK
ncbi:MAG TPA: universal stress protein [Actinomycetota bacterium]|nr:universal stress protein [Actinomycetota bacterium]